MVAETGVDSQIAAEQVYHEAKSRLISWCDEPEILGAYRRTIPIRPDYASKDTTRLFSRLGQPMSLEDIDKLPYEMVSYTEMAEEYYSATRFKYLNKHDMTPKEWVELRRAEILRDHLHGMTIGLSELLRQSAQEEKIHPSHYPKGLQLIRDGLYAEIILSAMELEEDIGAPFELPAYFFQAYRGLETTTTMGYVFQNSLYDLWQKYYMVKQRGKPYASTFIEDNRTFTEANQQTYVEGGETGFTPLEIARDASIIDYLKAQELLPNPSLRPQFSPIVRVIDFGAYNGRRRLLPLLKILEKSGYDAHNSYQAVGIDIADVPDPIKQMELLNVSFAEAGARQGLKWRFDIGKIDWSSYNLVPTVEEQALAIASLNRVLTNRPVGIAIIDTAFPEGVGSFGDAIREYKRGHPEDPEGMMAFHYVDSPKAIPVLLNYYEMLFRMFESAGFDIINIPPGWQPDPSRTALENEQNRRAKRYEYMKRLISGEEDIENDKTDAIQKPAWNAHGRPRLTLVCKKVREIEETDNMVLLPSIARRLPIAA